MGSDIPLIFLSTDNNGLQSATCAHPPILPADVFMSLLDPI